VRPAPKKPHYAKYEVVLVSFSSDQLDALTALGLRLGLPRMVLVRRAAALALAQPDIAVSPKVARSGPFFSFFAALPLGQRVALTKTARRVSVPRSVLVRAGVDRLLAEPELLVRDAKAVKP
jgi:hypothetical protein